MIEKETKILSRNKIRLVLGLTVCFVFLLTYTGCSTLYISKNTDYLKTIFIEESHYSAGDGHTGTCDVQPLSIDTEISILSLTEDRVLHDIDSRISDSVISVGKEE